MVLAAGGETLWHVNSAAAAGTNRNPVPMAAPMAGLAASSAAESGAAMLTDPLFKPFVYVELPLPENCTLVQTAGVHINNDGRVVATMNNGSSYRGYIWYDELFADGWQGPLEDASGEIDLNSFGLRGINDELEICGTRNNSGPKAFFLALSSTYTGTLTQIGSSNGYANDINNQGVVIGTGASGTPVGWWDIIGSPVTLPALSGGDVTNALGVTPNTTLGNSLVVGQCKDGSSKYQAVVWYFDTSWQIEDLTAITGSEVGFAVDVNDDNIIVGGKLSGGSISETILWYYDASSSTWEEVSQDVSTDFIPQGINDQQYPEVVGENYLWICDDVASGTGTQIDLSAYALGLPTNMINMNCTDINDAGEIVGVGQLGSAGDWVAFKLVPYDVNNNGESDVREIALAYEADNDSDWLIDWAENLRVGLHAPTSAADWEGEIEPGQVVRLGANLGPEGVEDRPLPDEDWIEDIVNPASDSCEACLRFHTAATRWGTGVDRKDTSLTSEILLRVHSMMGPVSFGSQEALPDPDAPEEKLAALKELQTFAFRFAHCIDYIQLGNESFGGSRQYYFRGNEFDSGCDFTGDPKPFSLLSTTCQGEAVELILGWQQEMLWAALRGSALGGRPLRMVSAGITDDTVSNGYASAGGQRYLVTAVADWCNANQAHFAMHVHYIQAQPALDAIQKLVDTFSGGSAPWGAPNWRVATEVGTRADFPNPPNHTGDEWWTSGSPDTNGDIYKAFFWGTDDPGETWEHFIGRWQSESAFWNPDGLEAGFRIDDLFAEFSTADFTAICWSAMQFDPGSESVPSPFLVEALRANRVRDVEDLFEENNYPQRFTPIKSAYELAGANHNIEDFEPHSYECDEGFVCPGCGGN